MTTSMHAAWHVRLSSSRLLQCFDRTVDPVSSKSRRAVPALPRHEPDVRKKSTDAARPARREPVGRARPAGFQPQRVAWRGGAMR